MKYWPAKPPADIADYLFNFVDDLEANETLLTRVVTVTGVTKVSDAIVAIGGVAASGVQVWLEGGTFGTTATVDCTVTTSGGRTYAATVALLIGEEPVGLEEAKAQVRYFESDRDNELLGCIADARGMVEERSDCILVQRQVSERFYRPTCRRFRLSYRPVVGDIAVAYTDSSGSPAAYSTVRLDDDTLLPALGEAWPFAYVGERFSVTYTAGFAVGKLPQVLRRAVLLAINSLFEKRPMTVDEERAFNTLCDYRRAVLV